MYNDKNHVIMDANQNYYRTAYRVDKGLAKRLTYAGEDGLFGLKQGDDISYLFYTLRTLESELKNHAVQDTVFTVTFEGGNTGRQEVDSNYKANRIGKMPDEGKQALRLMEDILKEVGYNVYKIPGYEADDVARALVKATSKEFNHTYLYTNDADWLVNLSDKVTVMRYKSSIGYFRPITPDNFLTEMSKEYGCTMTYNCILLYKALVGDTSDGVKGVKGFGIKKFESLINNLMSEGFDFKVLTSPQNVANVIHYKQDIITGGNEERLKEAINSLSLIAPKKLELENDMLPVHEARLNEKRVELYSRLGFNSIAKAW